MCGSLSFLVEYVKSSWCFIRFSLHKKSTKYKLDKNSITYNCWICMYMTPCKVSFHLLSKALAHLTLLSFCQTFGRMGFGHIFQLTSACNFIVFLITWNYSLQIVLFHISSPAVLQAEVATCWPKVSHWKIIKTFFNEALPKRRYFPSRHQNH